MTQTLKEIADLIWSYGFKTKTGADHKGEHEEVAQAILTAIKEHQGLRVKALEEVAEAARAFLHSEHDSAAYWDALAAIKDALTALQEARE